MGEKIILNKRVAVALKEALSFHGRDALLETHSESFEAWMGKQEPLNDLSLPDMAKALYIGYEVEETPEETFKREYFNARRSFFSATQGSPQEKYLSGLLEGMIKGLNALNIKIEGINK